MKDVIKCVALTLALLNTCVVLASCTETTNVVKWTYEIVNGGVVLGGRGRLAVPENTSGGLVIPEKIDGKPVRGIRNSAFEGCRGLTEVTIPSCVTNIEYRAFARCSGLASVTILSRVPRLGEGAFSQCPKLTTVCVVRDGWEDQHLTVGEIEDWAISRRSIYRSKNKNARTWKDPQTEITWCFSVGKDNKASLHLGFSFSEDMPTLVGDVVIPEGVDGHTVTDISGFGNNGLIDLTSLRIPKTVRMLPINLASIFTLTNVTIEAGCEEYRSDGRFILEKGMAIAKNAAVASLPRRLHGTDPASGAHSSASIVTSRYSRLRHVCAGGTKRLVIPEGVETIGWGCISGASWLEEVRIPSTVKEVDASAFTGCKGLVRRYDPDGKGYMVIDGWLIPYGVIKSRDLVIPAGVRHIADEDERTKSWENVTSVKLPEGLVSIGQWAFNGSRVESIEFPASLERCRGFREVDAKIRSRVVSCPPLRSVVFNSGKTDFPIPGTVTNIIYNAGVTEISARCNGEAVKTIQLPSGLISIAKGSLDYLPNLTEIVIPATVTNIGCDVFSECRRELKSVGVEKDGKIEYVPIEAFRRHWNLRFPDGCFHLTDDKTGIRWIVSEYVAPYRAHSEVKGRVCMLVGIEDGQDPSVLPIPESLAGMSVERVDWGRFLSPKVSLSLSPIEFEFWYGRTMMGTPPARTNALSAVELRIPRTLDYVDLSAVARIFPDLQSLVVEEGNESWFSSDGVLYDAKTMSVVCCPRARKGRVVVADGIKSVARAAFRGAARGPFSGCTNVTEIVLPSSLKTIGARAFSGCSRLEKLHLPEGLCSIRSGAFDGCVKLFEKAKRYDGFYVLDGWAVDPWGVGIKEHGVLGGELTLPDGVRGVADSTFEMGRARKLATNETWAAKPILSVFFPKSLRHIGYDAFYGAEIERLTLPDGICSIGATAFSSCTNLLSVSIPQTVETWSVDAGWRVGSGVFRGCTRLKEVRVAAGLRTLPTYGFDRCFSIVSVEIPASVTNGLESAFSGCPSLQSLDVSPENPKYKSIDGVVYSKDGKSLLFCPRGKSTVAIPQGVTNIGDCAFFSCANLTAVDIPEGVEGVGSYAFGGCRRLMEMRLPSTLQKLDMLSVGYPYVPERILTASGDAARICKIVGDAYVNTARICKFVGDAYVNSRYDNEGELFVVDGDALVRATSREERCGTSLKTFSWKRWRDPETGIAWLYSVQGDDAVDVRTEFLEGYKGHLEVPAQLGGKQVSGLLGLYGGRDVTSLSLPMSVTNVNAKVLESCTKLKSVKMNVDGELKTIGIEDLRRQWNLPGSKSPAVFPAKGNLRQGGLLRARRLQRRQQESAAKVQADAVKAQREAERAEQRTQLQAINEELKRIRETKAAEKIQTGK